MTHQYENLFPFSRIRDEQRKAISFILDAFSSGKKYCVCELPTGSGKSAIGVTVARALGSDAYILTTQKVLQDQYVVDFGPKKLNIVQSIKSATNYDCHGCWGQSCGETRRVRTVRKRSNKSYRDPCEDTCPYKLDKETFINSPLGITNFAYFLAETMYAKQLKPRGLIVIDECHNAENALSSFIEVTFSLRFAKQQLNCNGPREKTIEGVHSWIKNSYRRALNKRIAEIEEEIEVFASQGKSEEDTSTLARRLEMLDKHVCKVNRFLSDYNVDNWVMNAVPPEVGKFAKKSSDWKFEFKPIDVSPYAEDALYRYGDKVLLMSATIIDHDTFCRTIGIDPKDVAFISLPSPFSAKNRPVHFMPIGSMSHRNIDDTLPRLVEAVKVLLEQHAHQKGIIHCLAADTQVTLSSGDLCAISDVKIGQSVMSWNEQYHLFEKQSVLEVIDKGSRECIELTLENGQTLVCTDDHQILTQNRGWVKAIDLTESDNICSVDDTYVNDNKASST